MCNRPAGAAYNIIRSKFTIQRIDDTVAEQSRSVGKTWHVQGRCSIWGEANTVNKAEPRVSVVLPTYNQAEYLPRALEGVFAQTFRDYELIVVNDGSTDDTAQILDKFRHHYDFILIQQENQRLPRALNIGFGQARGSYLTWTSSDNVMLPNMLETLVDALNNHPNLGFGVRRLDSN